MFNLYFMCCNLLGRLAQLIVAPTHTNGQSGMEKAPNEQHETPYKTAKWRESNNGNEQKKATIIYK